MLTKDEIIRIADDIWGSEETPNVCSMDEVWNDDGKYYDRWLYLVGDVMTTVHRLMEFSDKVGMGIYNLFVIPNNNQLILSWKDLDI